MNSNRRWSTVVAAVALVAAPSAVNATPAAAEPATPSRVTLSDFTTAPVGRAGPTGAVTAVATNRGGTTAADVVVRYRLPSGVALAPTAGCTGTDSVAECAVGSLAPGAAVTLAVNLTESGTEAPLGARSGYFLAPLTSEFDPGAGEVLTTEWNREAGEESADLRTCWPISSATPNMDVAGGVCDGVPDAAPLTADVRVVGAGLPAPFNQEVVRSWQFETEITAPSTGDFRACGIGVDDGGYIAVTPAGTEFTAGSVVATGSGFGSFTSDPFALVGGGRYRALIRVSNRGEPGIDNGDTGFAGWQAFGISEVASTCGVEDAAVFGSGDAAWVQRFPVDVEVKGTADLEVTGSIESAPIAGARRTSVLVTNLGGATTDATVTVELPDGATTVDGTSGCIIAGVSPTALCGLGPLAATAGAVAAIRFRGPPTGVRWRAQATTAVDPAPANDAAPR